MNDALAVRLTGIGKDYRHFSLADVDLDLPTGSIMGFIGANGAGKSTTIRILMGLIRQDRGTVEVLGYSMPESLALAKRNIGFVSEDMRLYKCATIAWHMQFIASLFPGWDEAYAKELLRRFDLKREQLVKGLSHGQRVKAALLLALARRPRLLVLDEPTTGLDPIARHEVLGALIEALVDERRTVLFSSQNTFDIEQISDRITFIDRGRIVDSGDKEEFLDRWRRIRIDVPNGRALPVMPGVVDVSSTGRLTVVTTNAFGPGSAAALERAGLSILSVDPMTLEEIFLAEVGGRRKEAAA